MIHSFHTPTDGITLPKAFTFPFHYTPHPLTRLAADEVRQYLLTRDDWQEELRQGKMFGVLVIKDSEGKLGYLAAFSGNLAGSNHHAFFVPPVYDLLQPDGFFRIEEAEISGINHRITAMKACEAYCSAPVSESGVQTVGTEIEREDTSGRRGFSGIRARDSGLAPRTENPFGGSPDASVRPVPHAQRTRGSERFMRDFPLHSAKDTAGRCRRMRAS